MTFLWHHMVTVAVVGSVLGMWLGFWLAQRVYEEDAQEMVKTVDRIKAKDAKLQAMAQETLDHLRKDTIYDHGTGQTFHFDPDTSEEERRNVMLARGVRLP